MELVTKHFRSLTTDELYDILRLRADVFIVEQRCPYPDIDGLDKDAYHIFLRENGRILSCLRLLPPGASFDTCALGRVVSRERRRGLASQVVAAGVRAARELYHADAITLEAQVYARTLYEKAGFRQVSEAFLEDGIPHIKMRLELQEQAGGSR